MELAMKKQIPALIEYIKGMPSDRNREDFAARCGTSLGYLKLVMYGNRNCSAGLAISIDRESGGVISCDDLCPDVDFDYIRNQALSA